MTYIQVNYYLCEYFEGLNFRQWCSRSIIIVVAVRIYKYFLFYFNTCLVWAWETRKHWIIKLTDHFSIDMLSSCFQWHCCSAMLLTEHKKNPEWFMVQVTYCFAPIHMCLKLRVWIMHGTSSGKVSHKGQYVWNWMQSTR